MKRTPLQISTFIAGIVALTNTSAMAQWNIVGPAAGPGFNSFCLRTMGNDLYAGGTGVAKWDGTSWTSMGRVAPSSTIGAGSLGINSMVVFNGDLYVGGDIDSLGGVYIDKTIGVGKWNGTTWEKVGASAPDLSGVTSMVVYHNELYAGGNYGVNKWDGTTWTSIGAVDASANVVLCVYHDDLYAASSFKTIGSATMTIGKGFAKWDGTTWTALPGFYDTLSVLPNINAAKATDMMVFKDELYVLGSIDYAGTTYLRGVGKWNGTSWATANGGITGNGAPSPNCFSKDSNNLYIVGPFQKANSTNDSIYLSAYWDGSKWNHMFGGNAPYTSFFATENYKGEIYSAYTSLVKWTGPTAVTAVASPEGVKVYPNPSNGTVHISLEGSTKVQVKIMNTLGQTVYSEQVTTGGTDHEMKMEKIPNGIYYVQVSGNNGSVKTTRISVIK